MRRVHSIGVAAVLAGVLATAAAPTVRAGPPATQPAATALSTPAKVDTNSPKAAVKTFVAAQIKGDGQAIRDVLLATNPTEERMATAISDLAVSIADLDRAMIAKFGAPATEPLMGDPADALRQTTDKLDHATEQVNGDTATVTNTPDPAAPPAAGPAVTPAPTPGGGASPQDAMTLKKVGGQWKVSVSDLAKGSSAENVQRTLASVDTAIAGYRSVLADLNGGKLTTVDAVAAELNAKMTAGGLTAPPAGAAGAMPVAGTPPTLPPTAPVAAPVAPPVK